MRHNPPTPKRDVTEFYGRTSLLTVNGDLLGGRPSAPGITWLRRDVVVAARTVAIVAVTPLPRPVEAADLQLLKTLRFDILNSAALAVAGALLLALAVCRAIVRALRGEISATLSPLGGLRIVVSLPRVVSKAGQ